MSSINKILNDALDQTLLTESETNVSGITGTGKTGDPLLNIKKGISDKEAFDNWDRTVAQPILNKQKDNLDSMTTSPLILGMRQAGKKSTEDAKNQKSWLQKYGKTAGIASVGALGAGIGAVLLAKKLRAKKKAAAKKKARA